MVLNETSKLKKTSLETVRSANSNNGLKKATQELIASITLDDVIKSSTIEPGLGIGMKAKRRGRKWNLLCPDGIVRSGKELIQKSLYSKNKILGWREFRCTSEFLEMLIESELFTLIIPRKKSA